MSQTSTSNTSSTSSAPASPLTASTSATPTTFKSGFVALIGRPSVGKSSLLNAILKKHVAITSKVSQTTRKRLRGILNLPDAQIIFVDVPGIHKPQDALGKNLNAQAFVEAQEADIVAYLLDATMPFGRGDAWVLKHLAPFTCRHEIPVILVITKADIADATIVEDQITSAHEAFREADAAFLQTIVVSAKTGFNVESLVQTLQEQLPQGPQWFSGDDSIDATQEDIAAEFIREQVLRSCKEELPHATAVLVDELVWRNKGLVHIEATIMVERKSQKAIIVGKGGEMIKRIGTAARRALEAYFDARVHLTLNVEVQKKWREDERILKQLE